MKIRRKPNGTLNVYEGNSHLGIIQKATSAHHLLSKDDEWVVKIKLKREGEAKWFPYVRTFKDCISARRFLRADWCNLLTKYEVAL